MVPKFFWAPKTVAIASYIALEEAHADFEPVRLDVSEGDQKKPEYLAVNPKGRVPALVTDRGVLTETPAILGFIAQTHPDANLAPFGDAFALAQVQAFNSYLCSTVHVNHAHKRRGSRWTDDAAAIEAMTKNVPKTMAESFDLIERQMFAGPWVMGGTYTIADPYLFTIAQWLEGDGVDLSQFPKVSDHTSRMAQRPAVAKVMALA